ncbi:MAG: hypothetical protein RDV41_14860 [Planctomycetota bacterium]|nr:hypothetical protein [Planctomycetota bacterium]
MSALPLWNICEGRIMEVQPDFRELLALFNEVGVEYVVVGGYALAFHGAPRYTGDIDILVRPGAANARRVLEALSRFGFGSAGVVEGDFEGQGMVVRLGVPPVQVDLTTSLTGVSADDVFSRKVLGRYGDVPVFYIGRDDFMRNKRAVGRKKDLADLEALGAE